jgi:hypothetical protein
MKCLDQSNIINEVVNFEANKENSRLLNILKNFAFYSVMALILSLLVPVFCMVINHLYLFECQNKISVLELEETNYPELQ